MNEIISALSKHAKEQPESLAIMSEYSTFTYKQLDELVNRAASIIVQNDILPCSHSALVFSNPILNIIASLALMKIGVCQFSLINQLSREKIQKQVDQFKVELFISDETLPVDCQHKLLINWEKLNEAEACNNFPSYDNSQPCILISGSGTTGESKSWHISYKQMDARINTLLLSACLERGERHFSCVSYCFPSGSYRFWACIIKGLCNVLHLNEEKTYDDTICALKVDHVYGATLHAQNMLDRYQLSNFRGLRFPHLKSFTLTGSMVSPAFQRAIFEKLSDSLTTAYGTNECGGVSMAHPEILKKFPTSIGVAYPDVKVEIVDQDDKVLPANEIGHIRIKAPGMVFNYGYTHKQLEAIPTLKDGWFYPNDLAYQNEDGLLFVLGRLDDLIIQDGINIYPKEIEEVLESHPFVEEVAAYPVVLGLYKTVAAASIVVNNRFKQSDLKNIGEFARQHLGAKTPKYISIEKVFPRNERGKVLKRELREKVEKSMLNK